MGAYVYRNGQLVPADGGAPIDYAQPDPAVLAAAQVPDMRTASLDDAIQGALAQGRVPGPIAPARRPVNISLSDVPITAGPEPTPSRERHTQAEYAQMAADKSRALRQAGAIGGNAADLIGASLDPNNYRPQFQGAAPASAAPTAQGAPKAAGGAIFASPQASRPASALPPGAYVVREGRFIPHSRTIQSATPVSDETDLNERRAITGQMDTNAAIGEHQAAAEQGRVDIMTDTAGGLQALQDKAATAEAARAERMQAAMDKYGQMQRALQDEQIDPKRLFRNQTDSEKFTNSLLLALGSFGSTLAGSENTGMKLFMKRIDDDVAAQNKNLENKQQGVANQRGMVAMMREQYGDERAAEAAAKMAYLDMAKQRVDAWAASNGSQAAKDRAAEANAALLTKWNENKAQLERSGTVQTAEAYQPAGVYGAGGKKPNEADVKHLDTELRKEKIPQAYAALDDLEKAIDTTGSGDIEGLGAIGQHVPDIVTSDKGVQNRQAVEKAVLAVAHATGRVTPAEVALVREAAMRNGSARALRNWLRSQRQELGNVDRSVRASVPEEASQVYEQRGGLAPRDYSGPTAVKPAGE